MAINYKEFNDKSAKLAVLEHENQSCLDCRLCTWLCLVSCGYICMYDSAPRALISVRPNGRPSFPRVTGSDWPVGNGAAVDM